MSRLIFSLSWIFFTVIPMLCLTLDQPKLAEESSGLEPAVIKPYISDYKEISKTFLGHLLPFQSWFLKSRLQRPAGYARPAYIKVSYFQNEFMRSLFLPKYERKIVRNSTLSSQGRNPDNFRLYFGRKITT